MTDNQENKSLLSNEYLQESLNEIIKRNGFVKYDIELSPGSKKGDNYGSIVHKIGVSGTKENGEMHKLHLFCKTPVQIEAVENDMGLDKAFLREIKFYDEIFKDIKQFEAEKILEDELTSYAECLGTCSIDRKQFILMEDITKKSFSMFDRMKKLDLNHTQLVMKALGKFHAYSFAIRDQKPELFKKYSVEVAEVFMIENMTSNLKAFLDKFLNSAVEKLQFEGIYQEKWEKFHQNFYKNIIECCNGKLAEPYAVINHGDCWNNNMMFKYEDGVPIEVCLLDLQICRYASPILDLVYYIFLCTEKSFRDEHYETLLNIYYKTFSSFLKQLGSDPEVLFPYSAFQDQLRKFGKYGLNSAVFVVPIIATHEEDAKGLESMIENTSNTTDNENTVKIWTTRVSDVVRDMVDLGYLN